MFRPLLAALLALSPLVGCGGAPAHSPAVAEHKEAFGELTVDQVDGMMQSSRAGKLALFVYDNNSHDKFVEGHLPNAKWVESTEVKETDLPPNKEATLIFYCHDTL